MVTLNTSQVADQLASYDPEKLHDTFQRLTGRGLLRVREAATQVAAEKLDAQNGKTLSVKKIHEDPIEADLADVFSEGDVTEVKSLANRMKQLSQSSKEILDKELVALMFKVASKFADSPAKARSNLLNWLYTKVNQSTLAPLLTQAQDITLAKDDVKLFAPIRHLYEVRVDTHYQLCGPMHRGKRKKLRDLQDSLSKVLNKTAEHDSYKIAEWILQRRTDFMKTMEAQPVADYQLSSAIGIAVDNNSQATLAVLARFADPEILEDIFMNSSRKSDTETVSTLVASGNIDKGLLEQEFLLAAQKDDFDLINAMIFEIEDNAILQKALQLVKGERAQALIKTYL